MKGFSLLQNCKALHENTMRGHSSAQGYGLSVRGHNNPTPLNGEKGIS